MGGDGRLGRTAWTAWTAVGAGLLAGCFTTTADFRGDAEDFILNDQGLREAVATSFSTATCEEPPDRDVGTTFPCTAVDRDGRTWEFEIVIVEDSGYEVNVSRFP